jgi:hypothetical protein
MDLETTPLLLHIVFDPATAAAPAPGGVSSAAAPRTDAIRAIGLTPTGPQEQPNRCALATSSSGEARGIATLTHGAGSHPGFGPGGCPA